MREVWWVCGVVALPCLGWSPTASAPDWRRSGPPGGDVESLAAEPGGTQTLFLGTSDSHIFDSTDSAAHWTVHGRIGASHDDVIMSIVVDPGGEDCQSLAASATEGLFSFGMGAAGQSSSARAVSQQKQ